MTRGGQRADITVIGAPLLYAGGEFDDPACAQPEHRDLPWDYADTVLEQRRPDPRVRDAVAVCLTQCRHADECRAHALAAGEPVGVWGGTLPSQRAALRGLA